MEEFGRLPPSCGSRCLAGVWFHQRGRWFFSAFFVTTSRFCRPSHVADAHAERAAVSDAPPSSPLLLPPVVLLQSHLLRVRPGLLAPVETGRPRRRARRQGLLEDEWGFGFGHFVEKGEIGHVFPRGREGDDGRELVAPEDLVGQVGRSDLAGGGGRLNRGAHDDQQLKVGHVRVCPATAWGAEESPG